MDTLKAGVSDNPDTLEKGCPAQSLHSETCRCNCNAQTAQLHRPRAFVRRHWIAFGVMAFIWLLYSCGQHAIHSRPSHVWRLADDNVEYPPPSDGDIGKCVGGTNWTTYYNEPSWAPEYPYGAETTLSFPLDSDALYLISHGALQHGQVNIKQSTQVADTADVFVRVAYQHNKVLERAAVCRMERTDKKYGVGIFTPWAPHVPPSHRGDKHALEFDITLTLPAGNENPLSVKKLETRLPNYNQNVANLQESVLFDVISLTSANGKLSIQSVTSEVGQFSSLNGEIDGHFNARSSLDIHTANGRITSTVNLLHRKGADPSNLTMHTLNGQIEAEISLTSEATSGGEFGVHAESSHGKVELKFTDTPVDSVLRCQAETTVGAVQVELDRAFEGTYSLQTVLGTKFVSQHDVEDPAGRDRHRVVSLNEARGRVEGEIKWVENEESESDKEGYVILKTLIPSVKLIV